MEKITDLGELQKYLKKIDRIFSIKTLLGQKIDDEFVVDYYEDSNLGYRYLHSVKGSVHMALNFDGKFDKNGYYGQAKIVSEQIESIDAERVLELGCGKGFNSIFLAKNFPNVDFTGIDLTPVHLMQAIESGKNLPNLKFKQGNFQSLEFDDITYNLLFEVESICHASDMKIALSEAFRVLKPGGRIIFFDGFRQPGFSNQSEDTKLATQLVEASMAIEKPWLIDDWLVLAREVGFLEIKVDDISAAIMPNLAKFQFLARGYFKFPKLSRVILKVIPANLVKNSIAGLLMPFTITAGAEAYYLIILERPGKNPIKR